MGIINQCMLKQQKQKVPSEIDSQIVYLDRNIYKLGFNNSPLYNQYLQKQRYQTHIIEPSQKNSEVYKRMEKFSQPPSQLFLKVKQLRQNSQAGQNYNIVNQIGVMKMRRTKQSQSQNVNRLKIPRKSAQPLSYQPLKSNIKGDDSKIYLQPILQSYQPSN